MLITDGLRIAAVAGVISWLLVVILTAGDAIGSDSHIAVAQIETLGSIAGVVEDATTHEPLSSAVVRLTSGGREVASALTDAQGRFRFSSLVAKRYQLVAGRLGYLASDRFVHSGLGDVSHAVTLREGGAAAVRVPLARAASIEGVVRDLSGEPVPGVIVAAVVQASLRGQPRIAVGPRSTTDDRGHYLLQNLIRGQYWVAVPSLRRYASTSVTAADLGVRVDDPGIGPDFSFLRRPAEGLGSYEQQYYPGQLKPENAGILDVVPGGRIRGVDFVLRAATGRLVYGKIAGIDETSPALLRLVHEGTGPVDREGDVAQAFVGSDGRFVLPSVAPGRYRLVIAPGDGQFEVAPDFFGSVEPVGVLSSASVSVVRRHVTASPPWLSFSHTLGQRRVYLSQALEVREDADVEVAARALPTLSLMGRVADQGDTELRDRVSIEPSASNELMTVPLVRLRQNQGFQRFEVLGMTPGSYYVRSSDTSKAIASTSVSGRVVPGNRFFVGARDDGGELVVLLESAARVQGAVADSSGAPVSDAFVFCFPTDEHQWSAFGFTPVAMRTARSDAGGAFEVSGLPGGQYYLAARRTISPDETWELETFVRRLARSAAKVTVASGQTLTTRVRVEQ